VRRGAAGAVGQCGTGGLSGIAGVEDADGNRTPSGFAAEHFSKNRPRGTGLRPTRTGLGRPEPPVAVLTGPSTGSAGEAVLIAFKGRPDTRVFGRSTAGFATGNDGFTFSDGALLLLTMANDVDRTGVVYRNAPIPPDQAVAETAGSDAAALAATAWLKEQPAAGGAELLSYLCSRVTSRERRSASRVDEAARGEGRSPRARSICGKLMTDPQWERRRAATPARFHQPA
jgi:hypothetical protein